MLYCCGHVANASQVALLFRCRVNCGEGRCDLCTYSDSRNAKKVGCRPYRPTVCAV